MNAKLAKLIALRDRINNILEYSDVIPEDTFISLRDQFFKDAEKFKDDFPDLQDFIPQDYKTGLNSYGFYVRWVALSLIADIDYFINFITNIETIQIPNLKVSEEGVYFAGQHFDALLKFNDIISNAKKEIILIDNYLNEKILNLLASKNNNVLCRVLTLDKSYTPALKTFIEAFNKQYNNLEVKTTPLFHDRFVVLDKKDFYHFGASIKDAGNKGFMFSKIEQDFIKDELLIKIEAEWKK